MFILVAPSDKREQLCSDKSLLFNTCSLFDIVSSIFYIVNYQYILNKIAAKGKIELTKISKG